VEGTPRVYGSFGYKVSVKVAQVVLAGEIACSCHGPDWPAFYWKGVKVPFMG